MRALGTLVLAILLATLVVRCVELDPPSHHPVCLPGFIFNLVFINKNLNRPDESEERVVVVASVVFWAVASWPFIYGLSRFLLRKDRPNDLKEDEKR
jgi:hypothetical protein